MKAIVYTHYGSPDVLQLKTVEKPTPKANEVLIKVHAACVNAADLHYLRGAPYVFRFACGLLKPKNPFLGADVAGRIEVVGKNVTQFKVGDEVFGDLSDYGRGTFAEYVCAGEDVLVSKPSRLSFEEAAAVPVAAVTALGGLRNTAPIQPGQKVLINGASGGVGTFAVQIAKALGAEVTAVCSTRNLSIARSLGADHIIDYIQEDFTQNGQHYDLILGVNGYHPLADYKRALSPTGTYVMTGGSTAQMFEAMLLGPFMSNCVGKKMSNSAPKPSRKDLSFMAELLEAGKVVPIIDRCFPLAEAAEALRYVEAGHATGKIVITVAHNH